MKKERIRIAVKGIVQGVGFRPFVYNLAESLNLKGFVINSSKGVTIEIEGENSSIFLDRLVKEAPPLSQVMSVEKVSLPFHGYKDFEIRESRDEGSFTLISPDVSVCGDCFREMLDKDDRRYLYPFINCTNCGPRYTITRSVPYDRPNTTMSVFRMCPDCSREYHDPRDRRFHAQPNACPVCGPRVTLLIGGKPSAVSNDPIGRTIKMLREGKIIAVKGLGGFHIACDATNRNAVERLRLKKRKSNKPFGLMSPYVKTIRKFCEVSEEEEKILVSNRRPIVLLRKLPNNLPEAVSPNNPSIGFMLPYTPLHYLLFHYPMAPPAAFSKRGRRGESTPSPNFDALVMTSGNISEEPIVIDNDEAIEKLSGIADGFLVHNRDIFMRVDDSVVRVIEDKSVVGSQGAESSSGPSKSLTYYVRRSRGYVPDPVRLHEDGPEVLGCGADLKNVFTLTKGSFAIPSQHIGDMENYETLRFYEESLSNLKDVYRVNPEALAYDLHPMYLSTRWALDQKDIKKIPIQHHYAHVGSVMAEKGIRDEIIGVSFDGTGFGTDGNLWGGEFLIAGIRGFERAGHLKYVPLPGGEGAVKEPWRIAVSQIREFAGDKVMSYLESAGFIDRYGERKLEDILSIVDKRQFSPLSSGAGRLFDSVSALLGVCGKNTFEGEAAIALEAITKPGISDDYPVDIQFGDTVEVDFAPALSGIIRDLKKGGDKGAISTRFHNSVVNAITQVVEGLSSSHGLKDVALCGGVFQNMYLLERTVYGLLSKGLRVHLHTKVPTNDAGISLGQAYIIRERIKEGIE